MASIYRRKKGGCFYITYQARPGERHTVKGCKDRAATEALARKLEADAMLRREGVIDVRTDQYAKAEARPLVVKDAEGKVIDGYLADYHAALLAKGVTRDHADLVRTRANKVLRLAKAERISQLSPSAVQGAVAAVREKGLSLQTCNDTLRAIKQFSRWLWRDGRAREDVLVHLTGYNVALDRRHDRRALTDEELARLIAAAESGPAVIGMAGPDRAMLYRVAMGTGFRANELRSLMPESFDVDADPPTVTVQAAYSKHRRKDVQPIRRDLADLLGPWLAAKQPGRPVFSGMPDKTAKMMRKDLAGAKRKWVEEVKSPEAQKPRLDSDFLEYRDSAGRVADFHALRHTYVSRLVRSGANVKVAQELARHSTPILTLGRYAHVEVLDQTKALDALPSIDLVPAHPEAGRATGTDGVVPPPDDPPPARSALSSRQCPGTPSGALTWQ
jgi:integrase